MPAEFQLRVIDDGKTVLDRSFSKRVEIGRQDREEADPYDCKFLNDRWRFVIVAKDDTSVSRHHLLIEPLENGRVRIKNVSTTLTVQLSGDIVKPGEIRDLVNPTQIMIGRKTIRVIPPEEKHVETFELSEATLPPGKAFDALATRMGSLQLPQIKGGEPNFGLMINWLRAAMDVVQATASSSDFFLKAAQAASEMVGLDSVSVLILKNDEWIPEAQYSPRIPVGSRPPASRNVLNRLRQNRKVIWEKPDANSTSTGSLDSVAAVVAAPILNRQADVIGALYGDRSFLSQANRANGEITEVQALLVEFLASGISAGLERLRHEQNALKNKTLFEQFFTADLSNQIEKQPDLLNSREREVTLLFCDIRGFSAISEQVGHAKTLEWMNDVMEVLSDSVLAQQGVLVDYIGDELMAMWGAPTDQPDHAIRACKAALDMLERLPDLVAKWKTELKLEFDLGIGLNTGLARVGNTGCNRKFKYGPLGTTVNLASRVQGATKHFKARLIITGHTRAAIDDQFLTRRLGKVRVVNIKEPVELYEMVAVDHPHWPSLQSGYEQALIHYENGQFRAATGLLGTLQLDHETDGPSLILLGRVVNALCKNPEGCDPKNFDSVWNFDSK